VCTQIQRFFCGLVKKSAEAFCVVIIIFKNSETSNLLWHFRKCFCLEKKKIKSPNHIISNYFTFSILSTAFQTNVSLKNKIFWIFPRIDAKGRLAT
jgi:hypothetical protein